MAAPHLYRTEAVVLRRMDLGEADRILTLYTPAKGKLRAVAKGVRRPTSRLGGHVELFTHSHMLIAKGRNLDIVTQSQTIHPFLGLRDDLFLISCACYVAELLDQLTADHIENYAAYELLLSTLHRLAEGRSPEMALHLFEVRLLGHMGYRPELHRCVHCKRLVEAEGNLFSSAGGGVLCASCGPSDHAAGPISVGAFKLLRTFQEGDYALASRLRVGEGLGREVDGLLRGYIRYILERQLKSLSFLDTLRQEHLVAQRSRQPGGGDEGRSFAPLG